MVSIGILSDTHGSLPENAAGFFEPVDIIFHAGDIGNLKVIEMLEQISPVIAVHGNIDGYPTRGQYPEYQITMIENCKVCMTHIGGTPSRYSKLAKQLINEHKPDLFICGHSHILKIMHDQKSKMLYINPGAAGKQGLHQKITMIRLNITEKRFNDLEVFERSRSPRHY